MVSVLQSESSEKDCSWALCDPVSPRRSGDPPRPSLLIVPPPSPRAALQRTSSWVGPSWPKFRLARDCTSVVEVVVVPGIGISGSPVVVARGKKAAAAWASAGVSASWRLAGGAKDPEGDPRSACFLLPSSVISWLVGFRVKNRPDDLFFI